MKNNILLIGSLIVYGGAMATTLNAEKIINYFKNKGQLYYDNNNNLVLNMDANSKKPELEIPTEIPTILNTIDDDNNKIAKIESNLHTGRAIIWAGGLATVITFGGLFLYQYIKDKIYGDEYHYARMSDIEANI